MNVSFATMEQNEAAAALLAEQWGQKVTEV
jgi:hypothetical protein